MDWVTSIHQAIQYIEEHLREELTIREIAQQAALSPFYFQKGFAMPVSYTHLDVYKRQAVAHQPVYAALLVRNIPIHAHGKI